MLLFIFSNYKSSIIASKSTLLCKKGVDYLKKKIGLVLAQY